MIEYQKIVQITNGSRRNGTVVGNCAGKKNLHLHVTKNAAALARIEPTREVDVCEYMEHHACYLNNTFHIFFIYTTNDHMASPAEV